MTQNQSRALAPSLFLFSLVYGGMVVLAGVLGNKQVTLGPLSAIGSWLGTGPLAVEAGIFPFLMLVALSSAVSELHGQTVGTRIVLWGFVPLILSMALIGLVYILPAAGDMDPARLDAFNIILGTSPRFMAAGIISYGTSQMLNVTIFNRLRGARAAGAMDDGPRTGWLAARGAIASALSQIVDTLLFVSIAFYGLFPIAELMAGQMLSKVVLSLTLIPLVITLLVGYGRRMDGSAAT